MTLAQARALLAVAEHGSFSQAALELDVSQAAVSSSVRELERELGVRLFERGRFGARTVPLGERVVEQARAMLGAEAAIHQLAAASRGEVTGAVRVAVFHSVASYVLPAAIGELAHRHPDVQVEWVEPGVVDAANPSRHTSFLMLDTLRDLRADVAFVQLPLPARSEPLDGFLLWELLDDTYVALVAPALLREYGVATFTSALLLEAPLLTNPDVACGRMVLDHIHANLGVPRAVRSIHDDVAIARMAERGIGIGLLPRLAVEAVGEGLALVPLEPRLTRTIAVAIRADGLKVPAVRALLGALGTLYPEAGLPSVPMEWRRDASAAD